MLLPKIVAFIIYPGVISLDLTGPAGVFDGANLVLERQGIAPAYELAYVSAHSSPVYSHCGLPMSPDNHSENCSPHTLVLPGCSDVDKASQDPLLRTSVLAMAAKSARLVSVCSGSLLLAAWGVLDGKRATTHWAGVAEMSRRYPRVTVDPDAIFVRDGQIYTSAGVTAGIDLALSLVEEDLGAEIALAVARVLVVYRRRVGNQSQFSEPLRLQSLAVSRFSSLHDWMLLRLRENLGVERLAEQAGMSPRNFARVFQAETGWTPGKYVERLRLDHARERIESGEKHLQTVAASAGFASEEQLRRAFIRCLGTTPSAYSWNFAPPCPGP